MSQESSGQIEDGSDEEFASSEGLRAVLTHIAAFGTEGWQTPVATRLLAYAERRYQPICKAWGREPADAATAAFLAMRTTSVLTADDPWAVVTHAVRLDIIAEAHAERQLTSADKAVRPEHRPVGLPVRTGIDRTFLLDHAVDDLVDPAGDDGPFVGLLARVAAFLIDLGWPQELACSVVAYVVERTAAKQTRAAALDALRRDVAARGNFGLEPERWNALLRLMLGSPSSHGLLARLLVGDSPDEIRADEQLVDVIVDVTW